jgi:kynurenine formamidase
VSFTVPSTIKGHSLTVEEFESIYSDCTNWGKWGPDDQRGTLNHVTPAKIREAGRLVRDGRVISLQLPMDDNGPQTGAFGRYNPIHHMVVSGADHVAQTEPSPLGFGYADDSLFLFLQGGTQWDALSHIFRDGRMYNGFPANHVSSRGARSLGIEQSPTLVSRGVLLDLVAVLGEPMSPGDVVLPELLDEACAHAGVSVGEGDIVLIRTGDMLARRDLPAWGDFALGDAPGLSLRSARWLAQHRVAGVVTDTWGVEVRPNEIADAFQPMHLVMIVSMGLHMGEIWDLEALAADCAHDRRYEFMLVAPSLRITGAVGSPSNPQAIK